MSEEFLRLVDSIHRDKGVEKGMLFEAIEAALLSAARKRFPATSEVTIRVNRSTGEIEAFENNERVELKDFGRIAAHTAKQVMTQKIREAERDVIYKEFSEKLGTIVSGSCQRFEKGALVVNLGRTEGIVPRKEQVFNESYHTGERIRAYVINVKPVGQRVSIILSRTHPELVSELFAIEVPEISERIIEIKGVVREPGHRTKIAVVSKDPKVDPIGACVGVRGTRIRSIVDELNGEKIDIVRWNEAPDTFIRNALSPAEITVVEMDKDAHRARVVVAADQLSLAIGRRGQNVRLSAKLSGWHIDILVEEEAKERRRITKEEMEKLAKVISGVGPATVEQLQSTGFTSLEAIVYKGVDALREVDGVGEIKAAEIMEYAQKRLGELEATRAERERERRSEREAKAAQEAADAAGAEGTTEAVPAAEPAESQAEATQEAADAAGAEGTTEAVPAVEPEKPAESAADGAGGEPGTTQGEEEE